MKQNQRDKHIRRQVTQDFKWLILKNIPRFTGLSSANNSHRQWKPWFSWGLFIHNHQQYRLAQEHHSSHHSDMPSQLTQRSPLTLPAA